MTHFIAGDEPIDFAEDMQLRDYFAAKVINGMMANGNWFNGKGWDTEQEMVNQYAKEAYLFADAMLKVRGK
jgi:hypothetical protein